MQTVDASVIIEDAQRLIGWDLEQLETRQKQMTRQAFSLALQEVWESWWWEQLMKCEAIPAATVYAAATAFAADDFCYYPATQKFYQAMQATTGNAPATLDATTNSYVTNYAYWAEAQAAPAAGDYVATSTDYVAGNQVRSLDDGQVYQLLSLQPVIRVAGAGVAAANGDYIETGSSSGKPVYTASSGYFISYISASSKWVISTDSASILYAGTGDVATPDLATGWYSTDNSLVPNTTNNPAPTVIATEILPAITVTAYWHALIPFTPSISGIDFVRAVGANDLRNSPNPTQVDYESTLDGIRIPGWDSGVPWVWYRRPTPILTGDDFDATVTYTATPAAELVFN